MFDSFVFLPLSTRAYFDGRAYIKIILKNHARSAFLNLGVAKVFSGGPKIIYKIPVFF